MKTKLSPFFLASCVVCLLTLLPAPSALSQVPQGFNYQAVLRDYPSNNPIISQGVQIRFTIQTAGAVVVYQETHSTTTDEFGAVSLVVGGGTPAGYVFGDIDWSVPLSLKTEFEFPVSGTPDYDKLMGTTALKSVPYALVADGFTQPVEKLTVKGNTISFEEPLFEVKNTAGNTVFAVFNEGVRIYVGDGAAKSPKGGFAIGGFGSEKDENAEKYLFVSDDSVRVYINDNAKSAKGGFAIGGYGSTKGLWFPRYLRVTSDSTRVMTTDPVQGFGVKSGTTGSYLRLTPENYFIGHGAGRSIGSGKYNSFIGYEAGKGTITGAENIFIGYQSGLTNQSGKWNTFLGYQAGMTNTGSDNTFIGYKAGSIHEGGGGNVYIGSKAGELATNGQQNIFIGESAGTNTTDGHTNIFIGLKAGFTSEITWGNIFIGNEAGFNTLGGSGIQGSYNTFIGWQSGLNNVAGSNNTYVGTLSGMSATSEYNTMIGTESGWKNTTGGHNTFVGYRSGYNSTYAVSTGSNNTFIGDESGFDNSSGYSNVFVGGSSGHANSTGNENTFVGRFAGNGNSTGYRNTFLGHGAGSQNYTGNENVAIGNDAGRGALNNVGNSNVFVGNWSGWSTGSAVSGQAERNTFLGQKSGYSNSTGSRNTYLGNGAGYSNIAGTNNTYIGTNAGSNSSSGTGNVFLGYSAGYNESGDNRLYIANSSGTPLIYGEFIASGSAKVGINTTTPGATLDVNGSVKAVSFIATTTGVGAYKYSTTLNMDVPDYVFDNHFDGRSSDNPDYKMMGFSELNRFISENRHLPGVPSRKEVEQAGTINLQGLSMITLEKVEENTLYILELEKRTREQQKQIDAQNREIEELKKLVNNIMTSASSVYNH